MSTLAASLIAYSLVPQQASRVNAYHASSDFVRIAVPPAARRLGGSYWDLGSTRAIEYTAQDILWPWRNRSMPRNKIMIIRHAEKPDAQGDPPISVMTVGDAGVNNLTPRGWQRSGALVRFFAPHGDHADRPVALFAAQANSDSPSLRTQQTLAPLAEFLGLSVALPAVPDDVDTAAKAILRAPSSSLVAWEHKNIANLVAAITGQNDLAPHWSGDRFDMVLVLERHNDTWSLTQVPQLLLAGDSKSPLPPNKPGAGP